METPIVSFEVLCYEWYEKIIFDVVVLFLGITNTYAQQSYKPSQPNLEARARFQDAKFGMFIHWGIHSILGDGEWVMNNQKIKIHNYERLAGYFDLETFDAQRWGKLAKAACMKYITITTISAYLIRMPMTTTSWMPHPMDKL